VSIPAPAPPPPAPPRIQQQQLTCNPLGAYSPYPDTRGQCQCKVDFYSTADNLFTFALKKLLLSHSLNLQPVMSADLERTISVIRHLKDALSAFASESQTSAVRPTFIGQRYPLLNRTSIYLFFLLFSVIYANEKYFK
jgi:hypothetical protein